jgi:hypothetical protein
MPHHLELMHVPLCTESEVRDMRTDLTSVVMPAAQLQRTPGMALDRGRVEEMELSLPPQQVGAACAQHMSTRTGQPYELYVCMVSLRSLTSLLAG